MTFDNYGLTDIFERALYFVLYRVSQNYRIPSSGLSRGHPVDQVKMFKKKIAVTLKKISKLPIFVQKYLINVLAILYFPLNKNWKNKTYFFEIKLFFQ
jgi:hypothetical protein